MKEFFCGEEHPDFPGQRCKAWLGRGHFDGEMTVYCRRCKKAVALDMRDDFTAGGVGVTAQRLDKAASAA